MNLHLRTLSPAIMTDTLFLLFFIIQIELRSLSASDSFLFISPDAMLGL